MIKRCRGQKRNNPIQESNICLFVLSVEFIVIMNIFNEANVYVCHRCDGPSLATTVPFCTFPVDSRSMNIVPYVFVAYNKKIIK